MSSGRKPLIRNGGDRPTMRNWPLFVFLIGLVLFFYVFYIYQAQSTQLSMANDEIRLLNSQLVSTKNKLVDSLASLESSNSAQKELSAKCEETNRKQEECMTSLRSSKLRLEGLEKNNKETGESNTRMQEELSGLKTKSEELERNNTALLKMISTQDELITQLNQTIIIMKFENSQLKSASVAAAVPEPKEISISPEEKNSQLEKVDNEKRENGEEKLEATTTTENSLAVNPEEIHGEAQDNAPESVADTA